MCFLHLKSSNSILALASISVGVLKIFYVRGSLPPFGLSHQRTVTTAARHLNRQPLALLLTTWPWIQVAFFLHVHIYSYLVIQWLYTPDYRTHIIVKHPQGYLKDCLG
jgi:hypothetical protein